MSSNQQRHLTSSSAGSSSFMDAELPSDDSFVFDGTNSDLAQQLYYRWRAGKTTEQLQLTKVPSPVQDRLYDLQLDWDSLDGIAQRALLWDSGFGVSASNAPVQIFTDGTHSMADLAIPIGDFVGAGCTWKNCTQPDGTISYRNKICDGDQMVKATRCFIKNFEDETDIHAAMWATGGSSGMIPLPHVYKHVWVSGEKQFTVLAIHMKSLNEEPLYEDCPSNGDYGSLVVACASTDTSSAMPGEMTRVEGSPWVSRWLVENYSTKATSASSMTDDTSLIATEKSSDGLTSEAVLGIIAACVVAALGVLRFIIGRRHR